MDQSRPLLVTQKARERILVAISWDERSDTITIKDRLRGTNQQHDLDLACFVFDHTGTYIDFVGAMAQDAMDSTGCIYHSGDDATGEGMGDDESISIELAGLPDTTKDLIFVVEIRSDHVFGEIQDPNFRIADGMTDQNLYQHAMKNDPNAKACILARISRDDRSPTGWTLFPITAYPDLARVTDWGTYLAKYL